MTFVILISGDDNFLVLFAEDTSYDWGSIQGCSSERRKRIAKNEEYEICLHMSISRYFQSVTLLQFPTGGKKQNLVG